MQRKNSILRSARNGMAMIMAITIIVIVATILALSLSLTTQTAKRTSDIYLYEQSVLLSQSAAEYAMLKLSQANPCSIDEIGFLYNNIYSVHIDMRYISKLNSTCYNQSNTIGKVYTTVTDSRTDGTVLMDITITANAGTEPIRYFRRSIQKL